MEFLQSQEGQPFIRAVAQFIRQHEKALANSLQLTVQRRKNSSPGGTATPTSPAALSASSTGTLAAALSFAGLSFRSHSVKSAQLTLTPHHLFYLLSKIEELEVDVGLMNVRIESIHNDSSPANYVSFLQSHKTSRGRSDADSIHSVSSVRSVMSGMSALWSSMGIVPASKNEKARLALESDMKYIYGAFTKLPSLRLTPDHRTPFIKGYEQFPFDTAVPLFAFKNLQQLEITDLDFRSFYGWDRLAEQLCLLTIKRGNIEDPIDILESIVLDDAEKRRRRSNRSYGNAPSTPSWSVPSTPRAEYAQSNSDPGSPQRVSPGTSPSLMKDEFGIETSPFRAKQRTQSVLEGASPKRPVPGRPTSSYRHIRTYSSKAKRSGSGSSHSSETLTTPYRTEAGFNAHQNVLPSSKWQRLVYLSLADNGLTLIPERSLQPLVPSLRSFNLSSNLLTEVPESLQSLSRLVSLDLSNCLIDSLQSLVLHPLLSLTTLKLKSNRLQSLAGIESLSSLENLHVQDNRIGDPDEAVRLTQISSFKRLWIKHNPLSKSFSDYRVRIMNHFRRVAGFVEDVIIDDQPASYSERKQLIERAAHFEQSPPADEEVVIPFGPKVVLTQSATHPAHPPVIEASKRLSVVTLQREPSNASATRKRGAKRRIVDLSESDTPPKLQDAILQKDPYPPPQIPSPSYQRHSLPVEDKPAATFTVLSSSPGLFTDEMAQTLTSDSPPIGNDDYQRNVEDLRIKLGKTWLSALGEQQTHWQSNDDLTSLSSSRSQAPALHHYHTAPPIISVAGTTS